MGESPSQTPHTAFNVMYCGAPLYSTDLNSSSESVDIGRNPSFSLYLRPAAVLRVNSVLAPLFHRLRPRENNKQKHREAVSILCKTLGVCGNERCCTMRRAWLMFHVSVVMVLFWGSTIESSMMYAELAICFGRYRSIQRGPRLVLVNRRLDMRQLVGVTSRKIMSSVKTWLLWEKSKKAVEKLCRATTNDGVHTCSCIGLQLCINSKASSVMKTKADVLWTFVYLQYSILPWKYLSSLYWGSCQDMLLCNTII